VEEKETIGVKERGGARGEACGVSEKRLGGLRKGERGVGTRPRGGGGAGGLASSSRVRIQWPKSSHLRTLFRASVNPYTPSNALEKGQRKR